MNVQKSKSKVNPSLPEDLANFRLLTEDEVAQLLSISVQTLRNDRCLPSRRYPYVKFGRSVRYRLADILGLIERSCIATA